jgi:hypothetical protein
MDRRYQSRRARSQHTPGRRLATRNEVFVAFDHTLRGEGTGRLSVNNPALRRVATMLLHAIRTDRLELFVSSGWVLLPPSIAAALSPLSFDLERRVLNRYARR